MNRSDREKDMEILKALLIPQKSLYGLEKNLKETWRDSNYATVYRHIRRMEKEGLLRTVKTSRKNGTQDRRGTEKPVLTAKGIATLLVEGDLKEKELTIVGLKVFQKYFKAVPKEFFGMKYSEDVFSLLLKIKPKINLEFFDEKYFEEIVAVSLVQSLVRVLAKIEPKGDEETKLKATAAIEELRKIKERNGLSQNLGDFIRFVNELALKYKETGKDLENFVELMKKALDLNTGE